MSFQINARYRVVDCDFQTEVKEVIVRRCGAGPFAFCEIVDTQPDFEYMIGAFQKFSEDELELIE